jgi:hypothetical protein
MDRAPADRNAVFPLFELLEVAPGVFAGNLLPALEPRHQAALALTCTQLRAAVQQSVTTLKLRAGSCCLSREHMLGAHMPNVRQVVLKPGNLHEAMFVLPLFLLQVFWCYQNAVAGSGAAQIVTSASLQYVSVRHGS